MILLTSTSVSASGAAPGSPVMLAILALLLIAALIWTGVVTLRLLRARKTGAAIHGRFQDYLLYALVNAAKIDGRVHEAERAAIAHSFAEAAGAVLSPTALQAALDDAKLSKAELVAYLAARAGHFSQEQKVALLKALLAVFVSDGHFNETEHAALIDYTAAIGFDRASAPETLRRIGGDLRRGSII
jgi:uncharacterized membrane protein YebE (DUF533 family)